MNVKSKQQHMSSEFLSFYWCLISTVATVYAAQLELHSQSLFAA